MKRNIDYDWQDTRDLPEQRIVCGFCGADITTKNGYTGWRLFHHEKARIDIYICHACGYPNFFDVVGQQYPRYKNVILNFNEEMINSISPSFIKIYKQSLIAEEENLDEIIGPGFRKSLEFLIKDYAIHLYPEIQETIKNEFLGKVIKRIKDPNIERAASRASWLGNDESHYVRIWLERDISDLKHLIKVAISAIESAETLKEYEKAMPSPAPPED